MILDEYQEELILNKIKSRIIDIEISIKNKDANLKWRYIQCLHDILGVLMFLDILTLDEFKFLADGLREKYQGQ